MTESMPASNRPHVQAQMEKSGHSLPGEVRLRAKDERNPNKRAGIGYTGRRRGIETLRHIPQRYPKERSRKEDGAPLSARPWRGRKRWRMSGENIFVLKTRTGLPVGRAGGGSEDGCDPNKTPIPKQLFYILEYSVQLRICFLASHLLPHLVSIATSSEAEARKVRTACGYREHFRVARQGALPPELAHEISQMSPSHGPASAAALPDSRR